MADKVLDSICKTVEKVSISDEAKEVHEEEDNNDGDNKIKIMTINVQNNGGVNASKRHSYFKNIITENKPHVIFLQECNKADYKGINNYRLYKEPETIITKKSSGSSVTTNYLRATILLEIKNDICVPQDFKKPIKKADIKGNMLSLEAIETSINARLALGKVIIGKEMLYIGSWHGPKLKTQLVREEVFIELRKFMSEIVCMDGDKVNHHPWIVGGDFNIAHYKVNKTEHLRDKAKIVQTSEDIIYYLCHPVLFGCVEKVTSYMVEKNILDHKPAVLTIDIRKVEKEMEKERNSRAEEKANVERKETADESKQNQQTKTKETVS